MRERRLVIFGDTISVHVQRWVRGLADRGWHIRIISLGGGDIDGADCQVIPRRGRLSFVTQSNRAAKLAIEFNPDIVHVHYAGGYGLWGVAAGRHPLVVSVWGADVVDLPTRFWYRWAVNRTLLAADHVTATSRMLERVTIQQFPYTAEKLSVIPFGVDVSRQPEPMPEGPLKLCYIKKHSKKYGPDILFKALAAVRERLPDVTLTMAGAGDMTEQLRQLASDLGIQHNVTFAGFIPNDEVYSFLSTHHGMVMPTIAREAFGVAVLEASACARPTIATRVGGVPEVLRDGETGILVPPEDVSALAGAILSLATDRKRCASLGLAAREFVQTHYDWQKSLDMMCDVYEQVLHG